MSLEELQHLMSKHRREAAKNREHQSERQKPKRWCCILGAMERKGMSTLLDVPKRSKEMRIKIISITFSDGGDNGENGSFGGNVSKVRFSSKKNPWRNATPNAGVYPCMIF